MATHRIYRYRCGCNGFIGNVPDVSSEDVSRLRCAVVCSCASCLRRLLDGFSRFAPAVLFACAAQAAHLLRSIVDDRSRSSRNPQPSAPHGCCPRITSRIFSLSSAPATDWHSPARRAATYRCSAGSGSGSGYRWRHRQGSRHAFRWFVPRSARRTGIRSPHLRWIRRH